MSALTKWCVVWCVLSLCGCAQAQPSRVVWCARRPELLKLCTPVAYDVGNGVAHQGGCFSKGGPARPAYFDFVRNSRAVQTSIVHFQVGGVPPRPPCCSHPPHTVAVYLFLTVAVKAL